MKSIFNFFLKKYPLILVNNLEFGTFLENRKRKQNKDKIKKVKKVITRSYNLPGAVCQLNPPINIFLNKKRIEKINDKLC